MRSFGRMVGVVLLGWAQLSFAAYLPFCRWVISGADPRDRQLVQDNRHQAEESINDFLTSLSGKHVSASQAQTMEANHFIDTYLMAGNTKPLVAKYQGAVTRAEKAFLQREKNLEIISDLEGLLQDGELTPQRMQAVYEGHNLAMPGNSRADLATLIQAKIDGLKKQNLKFEKQVGRYYEEWLAIRLQLRSYVEGSDTELLARLKARDGLEGIALESFAPPTARALEPVKPGEALRRELDKWVNDAKVKLEAREKRAADLQMLLDTLRLEAPPETIFTDLRTFLTSNKYLTEDLNIVLTLKDTKATIAKIELLVQRLKRLNKMTLLAIELEVELGVRPTDFIRLSDRLRPNDLRPLIDQMEELANSSIPARNARNFTNFRRQVLEVIDGNFFGGYAGAAVPTLGRMADAIRAPWLRNFVYTLFRGLYEHNVRRKYMPGLMFLLDFEGTAAELRQHVELFNGSTKDEFLLAMARFPEMRLIWAQVRAEALLNTDHLDLPARMDAQAAKVRDLGTTSFIDQSSYLRYAIMAAFYGGITWTGYRWVTSPAQADDDDDKEKKEAGEGEKELVGYNEAMEEPAVRALGVLVAGSFPNPKVTADQINEAALSLWNLNQQLSLVPIATEP